MSQMIPVCEPLLSGNELAYVTDAVSSGWISSSGSYVTAFEKAFADYCGTKYAVAVCNGTVAIHLALAALGIKKGDEVIIPNFTMIATAFAVCYTGAKPVFVDADEKTWNIDVSKIEAKITEKTKAIIPVHIFGLPCNMNAINQLAQKYDIAVIEDAAESHGALYKGKKAGNLSDIACFSFFANKNLTTGEGGMVVTNDPVLYDKCRYFKNMCFPLDAPRVYLHDDIGFNYRMSNIHAAIGLAQVEKAETYTELRKAHFELYHTYLSDVPGIIFQENPDTDVMNVHWMNAICIQSQKYGCTQQELISILKENGIETRLLFQGMHKQASLQKYGCDCSDSYPVTEKLSSTGFYLPSGSGLTDGQIRFICDIITAAHK